MDIKGGAGERPALLPYPYQQVEEDPDLDGLSLYRALARQHTGDPSNYSNVMNGVLDLYLRIWTNPIHPDRDWVRNLDNLDCGPLKTFFNALACPDAIKLDRYDQVVGFIADALSICIGTWTYDPETDGSLAPVSILGKSKFPIYHVFRTEVPYSDGSGDTTGQVFHFDSLLNDESGTPLMQFLEARKIAMDTESRAETPTRQYDGLQLKKLCWWWRTDENRDVFDRRTDGAYDKVRQPIILKCLPLTVI